MRVITSTSIQLVVSEINCLAILDKCSPLKRNAQCLFMHSVVHMSNKGEEEQHGIFHGSLWRAG